MKNWAIYKEQAIKVNTVKSPKFRIIIPIVVVLVGIAFSQRNRFDTAIADVGRSDHGLSQVIKVKSVKDGDTVKLEDGRDIRLCGIDAPETKKSGRPGQPGGEEAKQFLEKLVKRSGGNGYLTETDKDKYGRTVGELVLRLSDAENGEVNANSELIMSGNAYFYKQYSKCPNADRFKIAEEIAMKGSAGLWQNPGFERPWEFRKRMKG